MVRSWSIYEFVIYARGGGQREGFGQHLVFSEQLLLHDLDVAVKKTTSYLAPLF
jgi:hypothetical protein